MAKRGRPPTPVSVHLIRGTFRRDRHSGRQSRVFKPDETLSEKQQALLAIMPPELDAVAREAYEQTVRCAPWLELIDYGLLKCYAVSMGIFATASAELNKRLSDPQFSNPKSEVHKVAKLYASIAERQQSLLFKFSDELLLNPQARARAGVEIRDPAPPDPIWSQFKLVSGRQDDPPPAS
jgi:phage terminase small subunit